MYHRITCHVVAIYCKIIFNVLFYVFLNILKTCCKHHLPIVHPLNLCTTSFYACYEDIFISGDSLLRGISYHRVGCPPCAGEATTPTQRWDLFCVCRSPLPASSVRTYMSPFLVRWSTKTCDFNNKSSHFLLNQRCILLDIGTEHLQSCLLANQKDCIYEIQYMWNWWNDNCARVFH